MLPLQGRALWLTDEDAIFACFLWWHACRVQIILKSVQPTRLPLEEGTRSRARMKFPMDRF